MFRRTPSMTTSQPMQDRMLVSAESSRQVTIVCERSTRQDVLVLVEERSEHRPAPGPAVAEARCESGLYAQLAYLYRVKKWSVRGLVGVVVAAMAWSAVNAQHSIAPDGPTDPLYWASYVLEGFIGTVLVVFMVSGSATVRWPVTAGTTTIRWTGVFLLVGMIAVSTSPYLRVGDWFGVAVHTVAPLMIGIALFGHHMITGQVGEIITRACELPADDISEHLDTLIAHSSTPESTPVDGDGPRPSGAVFMAEFEREFTTRTTVPDAVGELSVLAREDAPTHADAGVESVAREGERAEHASIGACGTDFESITGPQDGTDSEGADHPNRRPEKEELPR
ncbi:hypothetical protein [Nocardia terpenica]|uniref:DUF2637 domain-containing protein n=1 Tax=Nocardia terpenica TaxID=455432 RepID=A0A164P283_9NOCA|nr:hypothetical protein [Nocardia terpenica]KZM75026.1 hypothetical protein AWN90_23825 [Nocardia terpenica]NQE93298.1 hypothetical protein [Nocardia terpenica]